jgi:tetratricopeptide (TPR) repeat protein
MKRALIFLACLFTIPLFAQQLNSNEWEEQAKSNIRLLPKYGWAQKTKEQKEADEKFIIETMELEQFNGDRTAASNHLIQLGFTYLYNKDVKTAMYRFNQAYLLDSSNTDIYWGYGAVYMTLGNFDKARKQYANGLRKQPNNPHLLTDYGTYFMSRYYDVAAKNPKEKATIYLDSALNYLTKSYQVDSKDKNTSFKLSVVYNLKNDCANAWKFYDACKAQGGQPITEEYTKELMKKCKRKK